MPATDLPKPVEDALREMRDYNAADAMEAHVRNELAPLKKRARLRGEGTVNRASLALILTGGDDAAAAVARGYSKTLYGLELTTGREEAEAEVTKIVSWRDIVADEEGNPRPFRKAVDKLYEAKMEAEGGVLVIQNIDALPPQAGNETAVGQAQNGGFQMLADLMTEYAEKPWTPVVVLTGDATKMKSFLQRHSHIAEYFNAAAIAVTTPPSPPLPEPAVETAYPITVGRPLKLKRPAR